MKYIIPIILLVTFMSVVLIGVNKAEKNECLKWQKEATEYPNYYITQWQERQCSAREVIINAEVI